MADPKFSPNYYIPGNDTVGLVGTYYPSNAAVRTGKIGGGLPSFPKDLNQGIQKDRENLKLLSQTFEAMLAEGGYDTFRRFFDKETLPLNTGSLSKTYNRHTEIDDRPETAALEGLSTWRPSWNEVGIGFSSYEITIRAFGRFYKKHRLLEDISSLREYDVLAAEFANNANETMENLAAIRFIEGANMIYTKSINAFDESNPNNPRLVLGANLSEVQAYLHFDMLKEAQWKLQNYSQDYATVDPTTGTIKTDNKKIKSLPGFYGSNYLVLVSPNGYDQLLNDPQFAKTFLANGGIYQQEAANRTLGINSPLFGFQFEIMTKPISLSVANGSFKVDTTGNGKYDCAFVVGGGNNRIGVELSLEGWTEIIKIDYNEDRKLDIFGLEAVVGWMTVKDFAVINGEYVYCIPFKKGTGYASSGNPIPSTIQWKK